MAARRRVDGMVQIAHLLQGLMEHLYTAQLARCQTRAVDQSQILIRTARAVWPGGGLPSEDRVIRPDYVKVKNFGKPASLSKTMVLRDEQTAS